MSTSPEKNNNGMAQWVHYSEPNSEAAALSTKLARAGGAGHGNLSIVCAPNES